MTQEEKAVAYDKALEYARYLVNERCKEGTDGSFHRADLQKMFPELEESEYEVIRKSIITVIKKYVDDSSPLKSKMINFLNEPEDLFFNNFR